MIRTLLNENGVTICILGADIQADLAHCQHAILRLRHDGLTVAEQIDLLKSARDVLDALALVLEAANYQIPPEKGVGDFQRGSEV